MSNIIKKISVTTFVLFIFCSVFLTITKVSAQVIVTNAITSVFSYDLQLGSEGQDVLNLQKFLNAEQSTAVAMSGAGSRGNETTTFGGMTKAAVIKFQNKYSISPADGYVGEVTRTKINELYPKTDFNKPYPQTITNTTTVTNTTTPQAQGGEITMCQLVELLINADAIAENKIEQARKIAGPDCISTNLANDPYKIPTLSISSSTTPSSNVNYSSSYDLAVDSGIGMNYSSFLGDMNSLRDSIVSSGDSSDNTFVGQKSLGAVRSYALFAAGALTNINSSTTIASATTATSTTTTSSSSTMPVRTNSSRTGIVGNVHALTENVPPAKIEGKNTYNIGVLSKLMSSTTQAVELINKLECDFNLAGNQEFGGKLLSPGVYCVSGDISINNTLTLREKGMYIFRALGNLNTSNTFNISTSSGLFPSVALTEPNVGFDDNGMPPYSIFWAPTGSVNIASNTIFLGTIISKTSNVTMGEFAEIPEGRILTGKSVSLNKNLIIVPPDPIKLTVVIGGKGHGSVSGPHFLCSSDKETPSTSATTTALDGKTQGCKTYYTSGETVTLTADSVSSEKPAWVGCKSESNPGGTVSGNSCTIKIEEDTEIKVNFSLDSFGGIIVPFEAAFLGPVGLVIRAPCITTPGFLMMVVGKEPGMFVTREIRNPEAFIPFAPVIGTLEDYNETSCYAGGGLFRIVEDMKLGLKGVGL